MDITFAYQDILEVQDKLTSERSIFVYGQGNALIQEQISVETNGIIGYYKLDELGSISKIYDSLGNVKASITYDEFGIITNPEDVNTLGNIFSYTGHV